MQEVYPGVMVSFSCRAEGFSIINYSWFMVSAGSSTGMEIVNETSTTYTVMDPMYSEHNGTGYYCNATNDEGTAVSSTATLIGKNIVLQSRVCH